MNSSSAHLRSISASCDSIICRSRSVMAVPFLPIRKSVLLKVKGRRAMLATRRLVFGSAGGLVGPRALRHSSAHLMVENSRGKEGGCRAEEHATPEEHCPPATEKLIPKCRPRDFLSRARPEFGRNCLCHSEPNPRTGKQCGIWPGTRPVPERQKIGL